MSLCTLALMTISLSYSLPIISSECLPSGYSRALNSLIHKASLAKNDTRYGLHEGGPKYGLTKRESSWLGQVIGHVICPGLPTLKPSVGSGALIGRNDLIITNVHVVRNDDGTRRQDSDRCFFETQAKPPVRRKLVFFHPSTVFGTRNPQQEQDLDYAIMKLDQPILGVDPIAVGVDAGTLKTGDEFLVVSAHQSNMKRNRIVLPNEPVIQRCAAREVMPADARSGVGIYSDCSAPDGASGSIMLTRDDAGKIVGTGILARSGADALNGQDYGSHPDKGNHSFQLMFDGPLLDDLRRSISQK